MAEIVLVTGGCRSGKSAYALSAAGTLPGPRAFVATCPPSDEEMCRRIERHRQARQGHGWVTIEEQTDLAGVFRGQVEFAVYLVDCVTLWVSNLMDEARHERRELAEPEVAARCEAMLDAARACRANVWLVTNEVGMGIVPENPPARRYRDLVGRANAAIAAEADRVTLVCCGIPLHLKGSGFGVQGSGK
jgi:adenosylcobinamide kinase/adenosylcobinamide-phosphate guanylyltransferase